MNIFFKFCILIFFSYFVLFKYLEECIDYILKIEIMFFEKMVLKVRYGFFVNLSGRRGDNKVVDLQKENEVLVLKELIRGLGFNKIENVIVVIIKVVLVIQDVVNNFDKMFNIFDKKIYYKKCLFQDDVNCIFKEFIFVKILEKINGRKLENFYKIKVFFFIVDIIYFKDVVMKKVDRLRRGIVIFLFDSDDEFILE